MCQWCGGHGTNTRNGMISDIHSNYRRELLLEDIFVPDNEETANARFKVSIIPDNANYLVELGDALVYQMRYHEALECFEKAHEIRPSRYDIVRKMAIRYLSTLQIEKSRKCFKWCLERVEDKLDEQYRLALLDYYEGDYMGCIEKMQPCYEMSRDNSEMYVAVLYWDVLCNVKLKKPIDHILDKYSDDIDCGHHIGYQQALRLFKHKDLNAINGVEGNGELASSLYMYGLYHYYLYIGELDKANETLSYLMTLDTYFSSFAFIGAFIDYQRVLKEKALIKQLQGLKKVAIAYSGGVDSTYLLHAVKKSGIEYKAYYVNSSLQSKNQISETFDAIKQMNANFEVLDVDILANKDIVNNSKDRCYHCKKEIFTNLSKKANEDGYPILIDGTNLDDTKYSRPGARAIEELGVISPLCANKLTKNEIRELMREQNVVGANKPANSCLATRIETNENLNIDRLYKVDYSEDILRQMGYEDFRVRISGKLAILEFNRRQKDKAEAEFTKIKEMLEDQFDSIELSEIWR